MTITEHKICISCGEVISETDDLIPSAFGPYHGAPYNCVEGREDKDIPWYQK